MDQQAVPASKHPALDDQQDDADDPQSSSILQHYAYRSMAFAERYLASDPQSPEQAGRWFHTALVFLDVLKAGSHLHYTEEHERVRQYAHSRTRMYSHLLGNLVPLYADKDVRDLYTFEEDKPALGQGSYGLVMKVVHKQTTNPYACKILYVSRASVNGAKEITKLHSEVSIMRELDHPHIVRLREVFYAKKRIYLIMDLCTGGNLLDYMKKNPIHKNSEALARDFLRQMLYAVKYLHEHQIVHRDLKLENWLLEDASGKNNLKLIDFGLSKFFSKNELMAQSVGSLYYVAPEVLENSYSEACDLWSIGVIAYMLLFGRPPFWGSSNDQMRTRIRNAQYAFPPEIKVSPEARDFVVKLLVKDVTQRMTADDALKHPWLVTEEAPPADLASGTPRSLGISRSQVLSSLVEFSAFGTLRKLMLEVLAFNLTPDQVRDLGNVFKEIDKDQKGTISLDDLKTFVLNDKSDMVVPTCVETEISKIYDNVTKNRGSAGAQINYNEFIAAVMWRRIQYDEEKMRMVFEALDVNRQGFLTPESIRHVVSTLTRKKVGLDFDQDAINKMVADADLNGDGCIDYEEFARLWKDHVVHVQYEPLVQQVTRVRMLVHATNGCNACNGNNEGGSTMPTTSCDRKLSGPEGPSGELTAVAFDSAMEELQSPVVSKRSVMSLQDLILAAEHDELLAEREEEERRISATSPLPLPLPRSQDEGRGPGKGTKQGRRSPRALQVPAGGVKRQRHCVRADRDRDTEA